MQDSRSLVFDKPYAVGIAARTRKADWRPGGSVFPAIVLPNL
jgi:hypothetical protein